MNISQEQFRGAIREAADEITEGSLPPLSLPAAQRAAGRQARPITVRQPPRTAGRTPGWPRLLAPLGAAAAIIAVVAASVAVAGRSGHAPDSARQARAGNHAAASGPAARPAPQSPHFGLGSVPPYYLALIPSGKSASAPQYAVIRDTVTGATVATIHPPAPFTTFSQVTGAADDRTFVLAAHATQRNVAYPLMKFFSVHFDPAHGTVTTTPLAIPGIAAGVMDAGLALSADGTKLAVAVSTGDNFTEAQLSVYSLASGTAQVWQSTGDISLDPYTQNAMSWAADGRTLAFNWDGVMRKRINGKECIESENGLWLLNTSTLGGSLLADSKSVVPSQGAAGFNFSGVAIITPDGTKVVAPMWRQGNQPELTGCVPLRTLPVQPSHPGNSINTFDFEEFSATTGQPVYVLDPKSSATFEPNEDVVWSNSSGSVLVVEGPAASLRQSVFGVLSGNRLIPIPGAPAVNWDGTPLTF